MKRDASLKLCIFLLFAVGSILGSAKADTVTFSIGMANILNAQGQNISTSALFQLVNLGPDGVFNPIPSGSWVGGDDTLINQTFPSSEGSMGMLSATAFDLTDGTGTAGQFSRSFSFTLTTVVYTGEKIGIRWFPTVAAANYSSTTTTAGMPYGQFTRQASPLYGGTVWIVPSSSSFTSFDPMVTMSYDPTNGLDPNSAGSPSFSVVPEPRSAVCLGLGALVCIRLIVRRLMPE